MPRTPRSAGIQASGETPRRSGEESQVLHKHTDDGMFTVTELKEVIPATLMQGVPNVAPREDK